MTGQYTIGLEKGSKKYRCPATDCGKKTFVRYVDHLTGEYISSDVGRCERINSCGYHYSPKQFYHDNKIELSESDRAAYRTKLKELKPIPKPDPSYIPISYVRDSLKTIGQSNFIKWLYHMFGAANVDSVAAQYILGSIQKWSGINPVFWQMDKSGNVRTGKIIKYDMSTGKRVKQPFSHIAWMHKEIYKDAHYILDQCLYGEHLLSVSSNDKKTVCIVESEKTAIIAALTIPDVIWMATGGISNMKLEKFKSLRHRRVILYPDMGAYNSWSTKADELSHLITDISVSDLLECKGVKTDIKEGYDLADYILKETEHGGVS